MNVLQKSFDLLQEDKKKIPWILILFFALSAVEVAGIGLIAPYMSLVLDSDLQANVSQTLAEFLTRDVNSLQAMLLIGFTLGLFFVFRCIFGIAINAKIISFSEAQRVRLKLHLLATYQSMPSHHANERNTAEYINSIHVLTGYYSGNTLYFILKFTSEALISISILCLLAYQNLSVMLILFAFVLFFIVGWDVYSRAKLKILGTTVNKHSVQALSYLRESLDGYEELRVLGKNKQFHQRFRENSLALSLSQRRAAIYSSIPRFLLELAIFLFVVVVSTGSLFFVQDFVSFIPTLALFGMASIRLLPSANALAHAIVVIRHNSNTVSLLHKDFVYGEKVKTDNEAKYKDNEHIFEQLELKNIHFSYNPDSKVILSNINLKIHAGDSIGIVGASGSGKSTLVNLVQGLLNPTAGEILVNKVPMTECIDQWHSHLAVIPQNVFLLDDSIASNVSLEFDLANIDKARLDHALKMASIYTFVKSLRDGSKTLIGEKGVFLSGGQKQRLILARAFYHNRNFLIMDEATSALDNNTEKKIVEEIIALKTKITIIIIAHRQSTIDHCDHILKVEDGRLSVYRDNK